MKAPSTRDEFVHRIRDTSAKRDFMAKDFPGTVNQNERRILLRKARKHSLPVLFVLEHLVEEHIGHDRFVVTKDRCQLSSRST